MLSTLLAFSVKTKIVRLALSIQHLLADVVTALLWANAAFFHNTPFKIVGQNCLKTRKNFICCKVSLCCHDIIVLHIQYQTR